MSGEGRPERRSASLGTRVAALVSLTVFTIAVGLFLAGSVLSRSWTHDEQKSQILAIARDHVGLLEAIAADDGPLADALTSLHPVTRATIVLANRQIGTPLTDIGNPDLREAIEFARRGREFYVRDAGFANAEIGRAHV